MSPKNTLTTTAIAVLIIAATSRAKADDEVAKLKQTVRALEQRIEKLEKQIAKLEPLRKVYEQHQQTLQEYHDLGGTPGPIESTNKPVKKDTRLTVGQVLQVQWQAEWWAAKVLNLEADGKVKIRYLGWGASYDETVPRSRLQWDPDATAKARKSAAEQRKVIHNFKGTPVESSGIAVTDKSLLKVGQSVQVKSGSLWWAAKILSMESGGRIKVRFDGWDSSWDEVVQRAQLQLPMKKPSKQP